MSALVALLVVCSTAACTGGGTRAAPATTTAAAETSTTLPAPTTVATTVPGNPRTVTTLSGALGPGGARVLGTVIGPDGPVPGATVRIERLVGDGAAVATVQSGPDGHWGVDAVNGGRYRLRAWRSPDLAALLPTLVFVLATETKVTNLNVVRYGEGSAVATVTPNPPVVNQPASLVIAVSNGAVDADGVLHAQPRPAVSVQLVVAGGLTLSSPDTVLTDGSGNAGFGVTCTQPGPAAASLTVDGVRHPLELPPCAAR